MSGSYGHYIRRMGYDWYRLSWTIDVRRAGAALWAGVILTVNLIMGWMS